MTFSVLSDHRLKFEIAESLSMHVGDIEHLILDAEGELVGTFVQRGIDGLTALEMRNWRQLALRRIEEAKKQQT